MAKSGYQKVKEWRAKFTADELRVIRREEARKYRLRHPEKCAANSKRWREKDVEKRRVIEAQRQREYRMNKPELQAIRMKRYKAKQEQLLVSIAGRPRPDHCELCNAKAKTVFDHCHASGKFRGWLCDRCNRALGQVKDDVALLIKMADYIVIGGFGSGEINKQAEKTFTQEFICGTGEESLSNS